LVVCYRNNNNNNNLIKQFSKIIIIFLTNGRLAVMKGWQFKSTLASPAAVSVTKILGLTPLFFLCCFWVFCRYYFTLFSIMAISSSVKPYSW